VFGHHSPRERMATTALILVFLLGVGYVGAVRLRQPGPLTLVEAPPSYAKPKPTTYETAVSPVAKPKEIPVPTTIVVDVAGSVKHSGLIKCVLGDRVADALKAAGGATALADLDRVNLADHLRDGDMIYVPAKGEKNHKQKAGRRKAKHPAPAGEAMVTRRRLNLNQATVEQLGSIPGMTKKLAARIVSFRKVHGPFSSLDQLSEVEGVSERRLATIQIWLRL
jgi:competence protein ComEA